MSLPICHDADYAETNTFPLMISLHWLDCLLCLRGRTSEEQQQTAGALIFRGRLAPRQGFEVRPRRRFNLRQNVINDYQLICQVFSS